MSSDIHLERQRNAELRGGTSASAFAPCVPTVALISLRETRGKHAAHRLQPGSRDPNLATGSHYHRSEVKEVANVMANTRAMVT